MTHVGIVHITSELLESVLKLPEGHHVEAVSQDIDCFYSREFKFRIVGPLMPKVLEGQVIPIVRLQYKTNDNGQPEFDKVTNG